MLNPNLSKRDAKWILTNFVPLMDGTVNSSTIAIFTKVINLIRGTEIPKPSCGCEYKSQAMIAKSLYHQHKEAIKELAK